MIRNFASIAFFPTLAFISVLAASSAANDSPPPDEREVSVAELQLKAFDQRIVAALARPAPDREIADLRDARAQYRDKVEPRLMEILAVRQSHLRALASRRSLREPAVQTEKATVDRLQHLLCFVNSMGMRFVIIEPGAFMMGSPEGEAGHQNDETLHKVTLTRAFRMGGSHVTRGQFAAFAAESGFKTDAEKAGMGTAFDGRTFKEMLGGSWRNPGFAQTDEHPVVDVSWNDATAFCRWLSAKEHRSYRLPTEAEWEYACRAGGQTAYFWGDDPQGGEGYANCADLTAKARFPNWNHIFNWRDGSVFTSPVHSYKPNGLGLYDMIGNTWEWCSDYYSGPYPDVEALDPSGAAVEIKNGRRVLRGGRGISTPLTRDALAVPQRRRIFRSPISVLDFACVSIFDSGRE